MHLGHAGPIMVTTVTTTANQQMSLLQVYYMPALKLCQSNPQNRLLHRDYYYRPHCTGKGSDTEPNTAFEKAYPRG